MIHDNFIKTILVRKVETERIKQVEESLNSTDQIKKKVNVMLCYLHNMSQSTGWKSERMEATPFDKS